MAAYPVELEGDGRRGGEAEIWHEVCRYEDNREGSGTKLKRESAMANAQKSLKKAKKLETTKPLMARF